MWGSESFGYIEAGLPDITATTTTKISVTVPATGWTKNGTTLGTAKSGALLVGSGAKEQGEHLESISWTTTNKAASVTQGATTTIRVEKATSDNMRVASVGLKVKTRYK